MNSRPMTIRRLPDDLAALQIATDEAPYLGRETIPALADAVSSVKGIPGLRGVLIVGDDTYFSGGASRESLLSVDPLVGISNYIEYFAEVPRLLLELPVPTVAAMAGHAIGGGFVLGLWCDSFVLAEESLYGSNFMALGFTPGMGATAVVEETFGGRLARELLFAGRVLKGRELRRQSPGVAANIVPKAQVVQEAHALLEQMSQAPGPALRLLKREVSRRRREILNRTVIKEVAMQEELFARSEIRETIEHRYPLPLFTNGDRHP